MAREKSADAPAEGTVVWVPDAVPERGWLDFLGAGTTPEAEFEILLGKMERPRLAPGDPVVIRSAGRLRCRVPFLKWANGVPGFSVVVRGADIAAAVGMTVPEPLLLRRWGEMTKRPAPSSLWFHGWHDAWWCVGDEAPFPAWATDGFPPDLAEAARSLVARFSRARPAPAAAPPAARPDAPASPASPSAPAAAAPAPKPAPPPNPNQRSLF